MGWEGPAGRRGPAELRVWATEQCVWGLRASWGPPVTAGLPGADQSVAREPPAQPAGGAEAKAWLILGCGQARGRPAPPQGRKGVFWKPGVRGWGWGGDTSLRASRGLCTSRPSLTSQPGPGPALGSEPPDAGSRGSHTLRPGKTFKDLGQENRRPVGGTPAGSRFKAIAHERVGAPLGGGGSSALPRGSQPATGTGSHGDGPSPEPGAAAAARRRR